MASACRSPPDIVPTSWSASAMRRMPMCADLRQRDAVRRLVVEPPERSPALGRLVAEEEVAGHARSAGSSRHPGARCRCRSPARRAASGRRHGIAVEADRRRRRAATTPDMILISVDLPAPLSPSRQCTSPGMDVEADSRRARDCCRRCGRRRQGVIERGHHDFLPAGSAPARGSGCW